MKASSMGLETRIKDLIYWEIESLENKPLNGNLRFREVRSDNIIEIPFELEYSRDQRELVRVIITPGETYFGNAEKIIFLINEDYYDDLKKRGVAVGGRFNHGGKLEIYSEKVLDRIARI
ncbi:MAG: hypothetical protein ABIA78_01130 [archaeon]